MFEKSAITQVPIADLLARRWSGRAYDPNLPVARDDLLALCEAARWSPSCFGDEPWRLLIWDRATAPDARSKAVACLVEGNRAWAEAAPVLLLATADSEFSHGGLNRWSTYDTGAAVMSLALEATARGLMVHQMGGFDGAAIRAAFAIPDRYLCMAMITVGYQLAEAAIPEASREREYGPRKRRPLGENFFAGEWGKALV